MHHALVDQVQEFAGVLRNLLDGQPVNDDARWPSPHHRIFPGANGRREDAWASAGHAARVRGGRAADRWDDQATWSSLIQPSASGAVPMPISPQLGEDPKDVLAGEVEWEAWKVFVFVLALLAVKRPALLSPTYTQIQLPFLDLWRRTPNRIAMTCVPSMPTA